MEDIYVEMIVEERNRLGITTTALCEGIYTADMFYLVEQGKRSMDRVTAKRLLARLGVDNANYEHYLDYTEYEVWKRRMELINSIEDGEFDKAEELLKNYSLYKDDTKNTSRISLENQFLEFMKLQIMRNRNVEQYEISAREAYENALKITVPSIDDKQLDKLVLSPLEINLVLEYKSRVYIDKFFSDKMNMYREMLSYIDKMPLGNLSLIKVYPKAVVYMYKNISDELKDLDYEEQYKIYEEMWRYCEHAMEMLKHRKSLLYMTEILEMSTEILQWFVDNHSDVNKVEQWNLIRSELTEQLNALKDIYLLYGREMYMVNDCYLYRESGIYCVNEVARVRRVMLNKTREQLCDDELSISTIKRLEDMKQNISKAKFKNLFEKLSLYPSYVNMGILSDKKEALELYEELRFAVISFRYDDIDMLVSKLYKILPKHTFNSQVLTRIESLSNWKRGEITYEQHIDNLIESLELTIKLDDIRNAEKIFLTTEELTTLFLVSSTYKELGKYDEAKIYIKEIEKYCYGIERQGLADGRIGIYEMIMEYLGSLYGDIGEYDISNAISEKLIRLSLKLRRSNQIHPNIYNIAWNNNMYREKGLDYNAELNKCITFAQLTRDFVDIEFYKSEFIV